MGVGVFDRDFIRFTIINAGSRATKKQLMLEGRCAVEIAHAQYRALWFIVLSGKRSNTLGEKKTLTGFTCQVIL